MKKKKKKDLFKYVDLADSILVHIRPVEKGFCCAIIQDDESKLTPEQNRLISTIGRGMIEQAQNCPDEVFEAGRIGLAKDRRIN